MTSAITMQSEFKKKLAKKQIMALKQSETIIIFFRFPKSATTPPIRLKEYLSPLVNFDKAQESTCYL